VKSRLKLNLDKYIPPALYKAAIFVEKKLKEHGFEAYLVGGSVRDLLLNKKISDIDYTTNATPSEMKKVFPRLIPVGEKFGTVIVVHNRIPVEITTFRTETNYTDGRRPEQINFGKSLEEDVTRRDFTINGMAYSLIDETLFDYVGGQKDLQLKIIRTIGDPLVRFTEDGLRPIRGCRIMANLGFSLADATFTAMQQTLNTVSRIAPERFYDEWTKTLYLKQKHLYWEALKKCGIFQLFFTKFSNLINNDESWDDLMFSIEHSNPKNMAAYTAHFFYYELHQLGSLLVEENSRNKSFIKSFFQQNRFPRKVEELTRNLIFSPLTFLMEKYASQNTPETEIKLALSKIDENHWLDHIRFCKEVLFRKLLKTHHEYEYKNIIGSFVKTIRQYYLKNEPIFIRDLAIKGNDILKAGYSGNHVGHQLSVLQNHVIHNPDLNTKEKLLSLIKQHP